MSEAFLDALDDDLPGFLREFGEDVVYTRPAAAAVTIQAIFDEPWQLAVQGDQEFDGVQPQIMVNDSDVPALDYGDTFQIRDVTFAAVGIEPDGTGQTVVKLQLVS